MSVKNFLLLLLFCLSLHACNARRFAHHKNLEQKFQIPNQNDQKGLPAAPKEAFRIKDSHADATKEDSIAETPAENNTQKLKSSKGAATQNIIKDKKAKKPGATVQEESLVSNSWSVPQNKHSENQPGFNLDYSLPRTHPPTHN